MKGDYLDQFARIDASAPRLTDAQRRQLGEMLRGVGLFEILAETARACRDLGVGAAPGDAEVFGAVAAGLERIADGTFKLHSAAGGRTA